MAIEDEDDAQECPAAEITAIARRAEDFYRIDRRDASALLRHIQWQADEIERLKVRLDPYLDKTQGNPAAIPVH